MWYETVKFSRAAQGLLITSCTGKYSATATTFCPFLRDPEERLLADVPLRCCGAEASHAATEVFFFFLLIFRGLDTATEEGSETPLLSARGWDAEHRLFLSLPCRQHRYKSEARFELLLVRRLRIFFSCAVIFMGLGGKAPELCGESRRTTFSGSTRRAQPHRFKAGNNLQLLFHFSLNNLKNLLII